MSSTAAATSAAATAQPTSTILHDPNTRRINALQVTVALSLTYSVLNVVIRVWIRRGFYGLDDLIAVVAMVLAFAQYATEFVTISAGLGSAGHLLQSKDLGYLNNVTMASLVLFLAALYMSKISAVSFMSRFAQPGRHWIEVYVCLAITAILGIASIIALTANCEMIDSIFYWSFAHFGAQCPSQVTRWKVLTAMDVGSELLILALPVDSIWSLRMPTKKKVGVLSAFYIRIPVLAFSLARVVYTNNLPFSHDIGVTASAILVWQEVELTYSLAATTLMTLRPFTKDFNTGFGMGGDAVGEYGNTGDGSGRGSGRGTSRGRVSKNRSSRAQRKHSELASDTDFELDQRKHRYFSSKRKAEKPEPIIVQENYLGEQDAGHSLPQSPRAEEQSLRGNTTTVIYASPSSSPPGHTRRQTSGSTGPDEITVTHSVEQKVRPRNMV